MKKRIFALLIAYAIIASPVFADDAESIRQQISELQIKLAEIVGIVDLEPGFYEVGVDFPEGVYDVECLTDYYGFLRFFDSYETYREDGNYIESFTLSSPTFESSHDPQKITNIHFVSGDFVVVEKIALRLTGK